MNPVVSSNLEQWLHSLPNQGRLKEVYIDVTWHQPGTHAGPGTLLLIGILVAGVVAVAAIIAYANR